MELYKTNSFKPWKLVTAAPQALKSDQILIFWRFLEPTAAGAIMVTWIFFWNSIVFLVYHQYVKKHSGTWEKKPSKLQDQQIFAKFSFFKNLKIVMSWPLLIFWPSNFGFFLVSRNITTCAKIMENKNFYYWKVPKLPHSYRHWVLMLSIIWTPALWRKGFYEIVTVSQYVN